MHVNILEMLAVKLSLMSLLADKMHCHVWIMSDNATVVCYINDMGGALNQLSATVWRKIFGLGQ